jgi:two-component system cell cycle sensor histidine kinase PleC
MTLFEAKSQERQLSLDLTFPKDLPKIWADPDKMHQVLVNLVSNAIKFTPERGQIHLKIEPLPGQELLRVSVSDTGIGIDAAHLDKLFNKFEQVQSARLNVKGPKGTGLGLAITRELVRLQGGDLGVESAPGKGSTFYFTVPTVRAGVPTLAAAKEGVS